MANNLNQSSNFEDEIDLLRILKFLLISKKTIIISLTLIFTIASIFYALSIKPSYKTSALIELGFQELPNGRYELIETTESLISNLKINLLLKNPNNEFSQGVNIKSIENKIISLKTTSNSRETNEKLLNKYFSYIDTHITKIAQLESIQEKNILKNNIELIETSISNLKTRKINSIEIRIAKLIEIQKSIDLQIVQLKKIIIEDTINLDLLKNQNELRLKRAGVTPTLENVIFGYNKQINQLKEERERNIQDKNGLQEDLNSLNKNLYVFDDLNNLRQRQKTLENKLQILEDLAIINTQIIGAISTITIKPKLLLRVLLGLFLGLSTGMLFVFITNFRKLISREF